MEVVSGAPPPTPTATGRQEDERAADERNIPIPMPKGFEDEDAEEGGRMGGPQGMSSDGSAGGERGGEKSAGGSATPPRTSPFPGRDRVSESDLNPAPSTFTPSPLHETERPGAETGELEYGLTDRVNEAEEEEDAEG
mmetsp:Transcript_6677/g.13188  ORF Transcript_6677/g.13188 Transcript_6677/m.13188 type:complete len:138 (-) Transcript_6677:90-503(-)